MPAAKSARASAKPRAGAAKPPSPARAAAAKPARPARSAAAPRDVLMLTRERIQEALDEAAARGRVTRKDANELVAELVRRGRAELDVATRRARAADPVRRLSRRADAARRAAAPFPIADYDSLTAVQARRAIAGLNKTQLRKVLTHERRHANRKSVVGAIEKALAR
ncbi:MAG: hypothetical protein ACRDMX_05575 [Solirubrobacteraceae bacterium]